MAHLQISWRGIRTATSSVTSCCLKIRNATRMLLYKGFESRWVSTLLTISRLAPSPASGWEPPSLRMRYSSAQATESSTLRHAGLVMRYVSATKAVHAFSILISSYQSYFTSELSRPMNASLQTARCYRFWMKIRFAPTCRLPLMRASGLPPSLFFTVTSFTIMNVGLARYAGRSGSHKSH